MSIISIVYLPEGIVIAADSRLTGRREYKDKDGKNILEKYDDNNDELISLIERRIFEQGFKLGAKLMLEVLCEDKKSA